MSGAPAKADRPTLKSFLLAAVAMVIALGPLVAVLGRPAWVASKHVNAWRTFASAEAELDCCFSVDRRFASTCDESLAALRWLRESKHRPKSVLDFVAPIEDSSSLSDPTPTQVDRRYFECPRAIVADLAPDAPPQTTLIEVLTEAPSSKAELVGRTLVALNDLARQQGADRLFALADHLLRSEAARMYALQALAITDLAARDRLFACDYAECSDEPTIRRRAFLAEASARDELLRETLQADFWAIADACISAKCPNAEGVTYALGAFPDQPPTRLQHLMSDPRLSRFALQALSRGSAAPNGSAHLEALRQTATHPPEAIDPVEAAVSWAQLEPAPGCARLARLIGHQGRGPASNVLFAFRKLGRRCASAADALRESATSHPLLATEALRAIEEAPP
ncbi:MAG: hypothetical protein HY791_06415 [Deltaproteobacteria bacterium]|nr:hypothetical protein [Deltaproteobacteria bacterium]